MSGWCRGVHPGVDFLVEGGISGAYVTPLQLINVAENPVQRGFRPTNLFVTGPVHHGPFGMMDLVFQVCNKG